MHFIVEENKKNGEGTTYIFLRGAEKEKEENVWKRKMLPRQDKPTNDEQGKVELLSQQWTLNG